MKTLSKAILVILGLIVIALVAVWLDLSHIIKNVVQDEGTKSLRLETTLTSARAGMLAGKLALNELAIASPQGFSAPKMLQVPKIDLDVSYGELRQKPLHVKSIEIDQPRLVIEQSGGALNLRKAMQLVPAGDPKKPPLKLVIDHIEVKDAHVVVRPGLPGVQDEIDVSVPTLTMKDVGRGAGAQNGAAMKDVAMQLMTALAEKAAQSDKLPVELKGLLHLNAAGIVTKLGTDAVRNVADQVPAAKALEGLVPQGRPAPKAKAPRK
jgi:uncharacterized protein involved in outer membrane biogenesis